ncbi:P-loop containing nucleoside triphosphate hydrolase protein [Myriangium duriaei CBS 260.36]|uniref:ATP-dependent DNA helicase n=1 Tax=Myriangium duriaei CBS 260.36 TaxID=1168546 RepID=A0A9P4MLW6_9PEZI|nr:P-loop containing nucleoside triphosphate hydrolase protein [Myriangium duriaei CBS 260.36]
MSYDDRDGIDDFDDSPRPAKRCRTNKTAAQVKAKKDPAKKKPRVFKESSKSAEYVHESDSDAPVKPARKPAAKRTTKARSDSLSSVSGPAKGKRNARSRQKQDSSDSENAFEPTKPPKTIPRAIRAVESDSSDKPKAKKPKHRVHEPTDLDRFMPRFVSQAPPPESSDPANLRGEIWIKQPTPPRHPAHKPPPTSRPLTTSKPSAAQSQSCMQSSAARSQKVPLTAPKGDSLPNGRISDTSAPQSFNVPSKPGPLDTSPHRFLERKKKKTASSDNVATIARPRSIPFVIEDDDEEDPVPPLPRPSVALSSRTTVPPNSHFKQPSRPSAGPFLENGKENIPSTLTKLCSKTAPSIMVQNERAAPADAARSTQCHQAKPPNEIQSVTTTRTLSRTTSVPLDADVLDELADLPSDAFSSSPEKESPMMVRASQQPQRAPGLGGTGSGYRQMTLHGSFSVPVEDDRPRPNKTAWPLAEKNEKPTHHKLDTGATSTWVYPTNLGTIREYQYNIVHMGLYHNLLVALPTGLGKTFVAATIMLNWFRWTKDAQIVFVAPTKPLVAQQVDACFHTVGIPRSQTAMLTGTISPALRAEAWEQKRVFFMTPQTMGNDLRSGICDPKRIVLLVVDEAHRATGNYAYVDIVAFLRRFNTSFRVLALTATPGAKVETVQQVIDGLSISRVEIRTEASMDIRQYVHTRETETFRFDYSDEQSMIMDLFSKAIKPVLDKLNGQNALWLKDPMKLTAFGLTQAQRQWSQSEAGKKASWPIKSMVSSTFKVLASLAHSVSMLKFHGIVPFFRKVATFKREVDEGGTKSKAATQIRTNENFTKMYNYVQGWVNNPDFIGHPKLEYLREVILNHFLDAGEADRTADTQSATRVMVFAQYRDSAEQIAKVLKRNDPMIRPHVFVGQAAAEGSAGMDQKTQLDVIEKFKAGTYNTLVATSIGEEGLDIGEVDLIICYDANASPIRMLQRMGRTGRKRRGKIVLLLMKDKEEQDFAKAKDNYEKMQELIASGKHFTFHDDRSPRILPKDIKPVVDKTVVEIPVENSQADLPMPTKGGRKKKKPPKKFHMPDNVITGFVKASRVRGDGSDAEIDDDDDEPGPAFQSTSKPSARRTSSKNKQPTPPPPEPESMPLPFITDVLLNKMQERELARKYQYVTTTSDDAAVVRAPMPETNLEGFRRPGPTVFVGHGRYTLALRDTLERMHNVDGVTVERWRENLHHSDLEGDIQDIAPSNPTSPVLSIAPEADSDSDADLPDLPAARRAAPAPKAKAQPKPRARPKPKDPPAPRGRKRARTARTSSAMEAASSSPPPTPRDFAMPSQAETLGSADTSGDEERQDPDAWRADSDLESFVVRSDQPVEWASSSLGVLTMVEEEQAGRKKAGKRRRVIESDSDE